MRCSRRPIVSDQDHGHLPVSYTVMTHGPYSPYSLLYGPCDDHWWWAGGMIRKVLWRATGEVSTVRVSLRSGPQYSPGV